MATSARTATPPKRRRVNVETTESRPPYEVHGENAFKANRAKNAAGSTEKSELEQTMIEMVRSKVEDFTIKVELGEGAVASVKFEIDRTETEEKPDIQKLYAKVLAKEITLEDFVSVCSVTQGAIKDKFGSLVLASVMTPQPKEPKLKMKALK